ncbi:MAG: cytochrome b N-terminal domain-containing protein [Thaumarchaeota archaeon]|nr:cytochrome b N-terminal domain-containing protein [Candidatus Calditenuaceae archaeon]MDW8041303.1 cytochrome b N-terminal domain-containing protein [Nitrososphaerota archaeon]
MSAPRYKTFKEAVDALIKWTVERLERTPFAAFKFTFPKQYISPYGYLGTLTAIVFLVLGVSGAILMFYYSPSVDLAFSSVREIQDSVPFGFVMRQVHYHASNFMVLLAVFHLYYQYFSGRYKIKNEVLWVTGIILGILTVLEAYTGYNLILNQRAMLAINIGMGLTFSAPVLGPTVAPILMGGGYFDLIVRFYALHVFIIPLLMLLLLAVHVPRALIIDMPMIVGVLGAIFVVAGMFPAEIGIRFDPSKGLVEVPEWYLTSIYAFLRTGSERFWSGALLPLLFAIFFLIVPFVDKSKKLSWRDRPFFAAMGIASIVMIIVTTVWGFYVDFSQRTVFDQLYVEPVIYYSSFGIMTLASFFVTYRYLVKPRGKPAPAKPVVLTPGAGLAAVAVTMALVIVFGYLAVLTYAQNMPNISMFHMGMSLILLGMMLHFYRHTSQTTAKPR